MDFVLILLQVSGGLEKSPFYLQSPRMEGALSSALHDVCIPFPRTSAVAFNNVGYLSTFSQALKTKRLTLRHQNVTPRTLSAINGGGLLGNVIGPQPVLYTHRNSNTTFYIHDGMISSKHLKSRSSLSKSSPPNAYILIYDCHRLLHLSLEMAKELSIDQHNIRQTCKQNRSVCEQNGRPDLMAIWTLAEMIATPNVSMAKNSQINYQLMYSCDPYRTLLLNELIMHFALNGDLQTAVILACLFYKLNREQQQLFKDSQETNNGNILISNETITNFNQQKLSNHSINLNSFTSSASINVFSAKKTLSKNTILYSPTTMATTEMSTNAHLTISSSPTNSSSNFSLLSNKILLYDQFKKIYADVLYGWQLLITRTLVS